MLKAHHTTMGSKKRGDTTPGFPVPAGKGAPSNEARLYPVCFLDSRKMQKVSDFDFEMNSADGGHSERKP